MAARLALIVAALIALSAVPAAAQEDICVDTAGQTYSGEICAVEAADRCIGTDFAGSKYCVLSDTLGGRPDPSKPQTFAPRTLGLAAYGEGVPTACTVELDRSRRTFRGTTTCTRAVTQSGQAWTSGGAAVTAPLCSGVRTTCSSAWTTPGPFAAMHYRVTLVAPRGQGWVAPPSECSGAGTDRLDCTFSW